MALTVEMTADSVTQWHGREKFRLVGPEGIDPIEMMVEDPEKMGYVVAGRPFRVTIERIRGQRLEDDGA